MVQSILDAQRRKKFNSISAYYDALSKFTSNNVIFIHFLFNNFLINNRMKIKITKKRMDLNLPNQQIP